MRMERKGITKADKILGAKCGAPIRTGAPYSGDVGLLPCSFRRWKAV